ncbi:MAG: amidohydrolase family protein [Acidimicrobiales bacterium]
MTLPRIISVDDHVIEPKNLWVDRAPVRYKDSVPHTSMQKAYLKGWGTNWEFVIDAEHPDAKWADMWEFEDSEVFIQKGTVAAGYERSELDGFPVTYEDGMRRGCYSQKERLEDMDANHTEASMCFPTIPRFCGQFFLNRKDNDMALECVRIYNDWMIDEWCGGEARGRLIPLTLVPLWDVDLAVAEIRRCADKGSHAVAFTEGPSALGLPSLYTGYWDPFVAACQETDTVINMHIGSSSTVARTSPDSPHLASVTLFFEYGMHAVIDWVMSGTLARFPEQRIALSEAQAGWIPFILERMDKAWQRQDPIDRLPDVDDLPSTYVKDRVFGCIFDDLHGLQSRDVIGMSQIMFETDYPHADSTWPHSEATAQELIDVAGITEEEARKLLRENAVACYGLDRYFAIAP